MNTGPLWRRWVAGLVSGKVVTRRLPARWEFRATSSAGLEELEPRLPPATFAVNSRLEIRVLDWIGGATDTAEAVVFFDPSVEDFQVLRNGLNTGTDAVILDPGGDGLAQMAAFLRGRHGLKSVGVVAHGTPGAVDLGAVALDDRSPVSHGRELAAVGAALRPGGELDLWSCEAAAGPDGAALVAGLTAATGAGVAASTRPVGAAARGGDWRLDARTGGAQGAVPFSAAAVGAFGGVLVGSWSHTGPMVATRQSAATVLLGNGKVLVTGGQDGTSALTAAAELYDPATRTWAAAAPMSTARANHTATVLADGRVLVAGGRSGTGAPVATAEVYDPTTNTWATAGPLANARSGPAAVPLPNGKVLVYGGGDGSGNNLATAEVYDPADNTWSSGGTAANARAGNFTTTLLADGRVLVTGGTGFMSYLNAADLYDPGSNTWAAAAPMLTPRIAHTATLLANGKVLVAGGTPANGALAVASAELYDPVTNTWAAAAPLLTARATHAAVRLPDGTVLVAGDSSNYTRAEVYEPTANTWSPAGAMLASRTYPTATLLPGGSVLYTGGSDNVPDVYDPHAINWTPTGTMSTGRYNHTTTALADGRVLVAGGVDGVSILPTAEVYNPATNTWAPAAPMSVERSEASATLLPNGKVLVAGGIPTGGSNFTLSSAELYDPVTNTWSPAGSIPKDGPTAGRYSQQAVLLLSGKVLIVGGGNQGASTKQAAVYDPTANAWSVAAPMAATRWFGHTATLLADGRVLVTGGEGTAPQATAEVYDPVANTWTSAGTMSTARWGHTATLLPGGKVLIAGGTTNFFANEFATAELYDPATNSWSAAAPMAAGRFSHAAARLPTGDVLVTGGRIHRGSILFSIGDAIAAAEVYHPATNTWTATGAMSNPREEHGLVTLSDGRILVTGGIDYPDLATGAEIYDPAAVRIDAVTDVVDVSPHARTTPVAGVNVAFSGPIDAATFTADDLTLTRNGTPVPLTTAVTVSPLSGTPYYRVGGLDAFTATEGVYVLTVSGGGIRGPAGAALAGSASDSWVTDLTAPTAPVVAAISTDTGASSADGVTSDNTLVLNGTAEPRTRVTVSRNGAVIGTAGATAAGTWSFDYSGTTLAEGTYLFAARAADLAGNAGPSSTAFAVVIDRTAPVGPAVTGTTADTGTSPSDGITSDNTLVIAGTAEPNSSVTVLRGGAVVGTAVADGAGAWAYDYTGTVLADGTHQFRAWATDRAGNTGPNSATFTVVVDTTPPAAPVVVRVTTDTGTSSSDGITSDRTLVFTGTGLANAPVTVLANGTVVGTTTANTFGNWTFDYTGTSLPDGAYAVVARVADPAGNAAESASFTVVVDGSAPAAPVVTGISTDTGASAADGVTSDQTLVLSGTAESGTWVSVLNGAATIATVLANGSGAWAADYTGVTLPAGTYSFTARAADLAGNVGPVSAAFAVVVDTSCAAPVVTGISTDTGASSADGLTSDPTLVVTGTAEANATVTVSRNGTVIGTTTATGAGAWSFDSTGTTLPDGSYAFTARAVDRAGNASPDSAAYAAVVDTTGPAVADVIDVAPDPRDTAVATVDVVLSEPATLSSFTFADLALTRNGTPVALTSAVTVALVSGTTYRVSGLSPFTAIEGSTYALAVNAAGLQDPAGNAGTGSASDSWFLNVTTPTVVDVANVSPDPRNAAVSTIDVAFSQPINLSTFTFADLALTRDGSPVTLTSAVTTSFVSGNTYRISGLSSFTTAQGTYALTVSAAGVQNPSGSPGSGTGSDTWVTDTTPPTVVDVVDVTPDPRATAVDTIDVVFSEPIQVTTFTYYGSLYLTRNGSQVTLTNAVTTGLVSGTTYRISGLAAFTAADGDYVLAVSPTFIEDLAGNDSFGTGSVSKTDAWTKNSVGPAVLDVADVSPDPRTAAVASIDVTFSAPVDPATFTFADVTLTRDGAAVALTNAVAVALVSGSTYRVSGLAAFTAAEGTYVLAVAGAGIQNALGLPGTGSASDTWVVDATPPPAPAVTAVTADTGASAADGVTADATLVVSGTAEPNATVALSRNGTPVGTVTATAAGTWTYDGTGTPLANGTYSFAARATDAAGNQGPLSPAFAVVIDTAAPGVSDVADVAPDPRAAAVNAIDVVFSEPIDSTTFTFADVTLTRNGTLVPLTNAVAVALVSGSTYRASGLAAFTAAEGAYVLTVPGAGVRDLAGNAGTGSASDSWVVDATAPAVLDVADVTPDPRPTAVDTVDVVFSEAVDPTTFTPADLTLTRDGTPLALSGVTVTLLAGSTYRVGGLAAFTAVNGAYVLTVAGAGVKDPAGNSGTGAAADGWTVNAPATTTTTLAAAYAGYYNPGNQDYVGYAQVGQGVYGFLTFDVGGLTPAAVAGLRLQFTNTDTSNAPSFPITVNVWDVTTASADLLVTRLTWQPIIDTIAADLSAGTLYGTVSVSAAVGVAYDVPLGTAAAAALQAAVAAGTRYFSIGLAAHPDFSTGYFSPGSGKLVVTQGADTTAPVLTDVADVTPDPRNAPVATVDVVFSEPVDPATLTAADLTLTRNGVLVALTGAVTVGLVGGATYRVSGLAAFTAAEGTYVLTASGAGVSDPAGNAGTGSASDSWVMDTTGPTVMDVSDVSPAPRNAPVASVDVVFSEPVHPLSLSTSNVTFTRNGIDVAPTGVTFTHVSGSAYRLAGLAPLTAAAGTYRIAVYGGVVGDPVGNIGSGMAETVWVVDLTPPTASVAAVSPDPRAAAVDSVDVTFSEGVSGFDPADVTLTRDGSPVATTGVTVAFVSGTTYRVNGLAAATAAGGTYVLTAAATGVTDSAGNAGAGAASAAWVTDVAAPTVVAVGPVVPGTRNTPAGLVTVAFSEPVVGVGVGAFRLTRDGTPVSLAGAAVAQTSAAAYTIDLTGLTAAGGTYVLAVAAAGSGVHDAAGNALAGDASAAWVTDTTPPQVQAVGPVTPGLRSGAVDAVDVTFTEAPAAGTFAPAYVTLTRGGVAVRLAGLTVAPVAGTTFRVSGLGAATAADGVYVLAVSAAGVTDGAGNVGTGSAATTWTVDGTPPDTAITGHPPSATAAAAATFTFAGSDPAVGGVSSGVVRFEVQLDSGAFVTAASPVTFAALADGTHTIRVRAVDAAGNTDATPDAFTWAVDTSPPDTTLTARPAAFLNTATAVFSFVGADPGGSGVTGFEYRLDGGAWTATSAGTVTLAGLADGGHTFAVRAVDAVGAADGTPATATWTVDTSAPAVVVDVPSATLTRGGPVAFTVTFADDNLGPVTLSPADVNLIRTGTASAATVTVAGTGPTRTVTLSGITGDGTLGIAIAAGAAADAAGNLVSAAGPSATFAVDNSAPDTPIQAGPPAVSETNSAAFTFSGTDAGGSGVAGYEYRVDGGPWAPTAAGSVVLADLADGAHTFAVRAVDAAGNADPTPAAASWIVDTTPPDTALTGVPPGVAGTAAATFAFAGTDAGGSGVVAFESRLDGGAWVPTAAGAVTLTGLADGSHTFQVRAVDAAGNRDATPATAAWVVDTAPPDTALMGVPPVTTASDAVTITFAGTDAAGSGVARYEYKLDAGAWGAAASPLALAGLTDGSHTVAVRAVDAAGNTDATPAAFTWVVDTTPPDTALTGNPTSPSPAPFATFTFAGTDAGGSGVAAFEYRLDGGAWTPTATPLVLPGLSDGSHTFAVRAIDVAGNTDATPAAFTWTVDTTPPDTAVTGKPADPLPSAGATFTFSGTDAGGSGVAGYEYRIDGGPWAPTAAGSVALADLADGAHTFAVRAVDAAGNADPTPAAASWIVDTTPPDTALTGVPPGVAGTAAATFAFAGTDAGGSGVVAFESRLDGGAWAPTGAGAVVLTGLADGSHTFQVRAVDAAGHADPTPASYTWAVDLIPPTVAVTGPPAPLTGGEVAFTAAYADAHALTVTLSPADVLVIRTGTANAAGVAVNGTGPTRTVTLTGVTGDGTLGIAIRTGTATDAAGNPAPASAPSPTVEVDTTPPRVVVGPPVARPDGVAFTVTYADLHLDRVTLSPSAVTVVATGTAASGGVSVTGGGTEWVVALTGLSGSGTLAIALAPGTAADLVGNVAGATATGPAFVVVGAPPASPQPPVNPPLPASPPVSPPLPAASPPPPTSPIASVPPPPSPPESPASPPPPLIPQQFAAGADAGSSGQVIYYNADGSARFAATPFPGVTGGVRTAAADFNGDGVADLVVGTGPGGPSRVRVIDGQTRAVLFAVDPFEAAFTGGVYVAAGDLTGDGRADLVVTPDEGGGPRCRVFSGAGFAQLADFFGIDDPNFRGGARAAVGDIDGDGVGDLIVAAGFGGGPRVAGYSGKALGAPTPVKVFADFLAFEPALRNGTFVAAGDVNGDGPAELIVGAGPGGGPRVSVFDGRDLLRGVQTRSADFFAGDVSNRGGVRVAVKDLDGDAEADVVTGSGAGGGNRVTSYLGKTLSGGRPPAALDFDAFPGFAGGVFVG